MSFQSGTPGASPRRLSRWPVAGVVVGIILLVGAVAWSINGQTPRGLWWGLAAWFGLSAIWAVFVIGYGHRSGEALPKSFYAAPLLQLAGSVLLLVYALQQARTGQETEISHWFFYTGLAVVVFGEVLLKRLLPSGPKRK